MGIKELKELVGLGLSLGELAAALSDGIGIDDADEAIQVAMRAVPGIDGAAAALAEYKAMTDEQAKELEDYVMADFDIANDSVEAAVEGALTILIGLHKIFPLFKKPL